MAPKITRIESTEFRYELEDVGTDKHGFNLVYAPGEVTERKLFGVENFTPMSASPASNRRELYSRRTVQPYRKLPRRKESSEA